MGDHGQDYYSWDMLQEARISASKRNPAPPSTISSLATTSSIATSSTNASSIGTSPIVSSIEKRLAWDSVRPGSTPRKTGRPQVTGNSDLQPSGRHVHSGGPRDIPSNVNFQLDSLLSPAKVGPPTYFEAWRETNSDPIPLPEMVPEGSQNSRQLPDNPFVSHDDILFALKSISDRGLINNFFNAMDYVVGAMQHEHPNSDWAGAFKSALMRLENVYLDQLAPERLQSSDQSYMVVENQGMRSYAYGSGDNYQHPESSGSASSSITNQGNVQGGNLAPGSRSGSSRSGCKTTTRGAHPRHRNDRRKLLACPVRKHREVNGCRVDCNFEGRLNMSDVIQHLRTRSYHDFLPFIALCRKCYTYCIRQEEWHFHLSAERNEHCAQSQKQPRGDQGREKQWYALYEKIYPRQSRIPSPYIGETRYTLIAPSGQTTLFSPPTTAPTPMPVDAQFAESSFLGQRQTDANADGDLSELHNASDDSRRRSSLDNHQDPTTHRLAEAAAVGTILLTAAPPPPMSASANTFSEHYRSASEFLVQSMNSLMDAATPMDSDQRQLLMRVLWDVATEHLRQLEDNFASRLRQPEVRVPSGSHSPASSFYDSSYGSNPTASTSQDGFYSEDSGVTPEISDTEATGSSLEINPSQSRHSQIPISHMGPSHISTELEDGHQGNDWLFDLVELEEGFRYDTLDG